MNFNQRGDVDEGSKPFSNKFAVLGFTILKHLIMSGLYVGAICLIFDTCTMCR